MTAEQAAQLIDHTLDLVHQRLQDLQAHAEKVGYAWKIE